MKEIIDKVLSTIKECENPINYTPECNKRDDILRELGATLMGKSREEVKGYAKNEEESGELNWFYTRFIEDKLNSGASNRLD
ncbi:hypothetical protein [Sphingobacterium endophyticum]|uniref:hypothetical protein n=1 Tax=Sphingobacterium endophyticum TaxID=2546448 RepID=UPI0012E26149|nr:hypothetical protein [Sphingobacterium endophyticum]